MYEKECTWISCVLFVSQAADERFVLFLGHVADEVPCPQRRCFDVAPMMSEIVSRRVLLRFMW